MTDCVYVRCSRQGVVQSYMLRGVRCTVTEGIEADSAGFSGAGQMIVRLSASTAPLLCCGDQIRRADSEIWYTVAQISDNSIPGSGLSHRKVIGKR